MLPILVGAIGLGLVGYGLKKSGIVSFGLEDNELTEKYIYESILTNERNPIKFEMMGNAFKAAGKEKEGNILLKRAEIAKLPKVAKLARRNLLKQAFNSLDAQMVENTADQFENEGCIGAASHLRQYANALRELSNNVKEN